MNSLFVIKPYKYLGLWVFDDEKCGLIQEPFVGGADTLIDQVTKDFADPENGFAMIFSDQEFPGSQIELTWLQPELSGNTYRCDALDHEAWLCPALLKYFDEPPRKLFVKVQPL